MEANESQDETYTLRGARHRYINCQAANSKSCKRNVSVSTGRDKHASYHLLEPMQASEYDWNPVGYWNWCSGRAIFERIRWENHGFMGSETFEEIIRLRHCESKFKSESYLSL